MAFSSSELESDSESDPDDELSSLSLLLLSFELERIVLSLELELLVEELWELSSQSLIVSSSELIVGADFGRFGFSGILSLYLFNNS